MTLISFSCPLCGHAFDPDAHAACASCPLSSGCRMVCCPKCGHTTVDERSSRLARWAAAGLAALGLAPRPVALRAEAAGPQPLTSAPCGPARVVAVRGADDGVGGRLRAYGIVAGSVVEVLQQRPVTVVRVEQTELALEAPVAAAVLVVPVAG